MDSGELHKLLGKVHRLHYKCSYTEFSKYGISQGQPRLLDFLVIHDGCIQKEIADNCDIEPATVTNILANMERSDMIHRENDPEDRRILRVFLTEHGRRIQKIVEQTFFKISDKCFDGFSENEREQTVLLLRRIILNLKKSEGYHD